MQRKAKAFHVKHADGYSSHISLSADKQTKLSEYVAKLYRWRSVTNLMSDKSFAEFWDRHAQDSFNLLLAFPEKRVWLDIGSGAGLPGIVIGLALLDVVGAQVHCIESDGRKCAFLRDVVHTLRLPVKIHQTRMEAVRREEVGDVEIVTARAFSTVATILTLAQPFLDTGALAILPRGRTGFAEVERIDKARYTITVSPNSKPSDGVMITVKNRDKNL